MMEAVFEKYLMDSAITEEEGLFFKHVVLAWLEFAIKAYMNNMARIYYQIKDEQILVALLPHVYPLKFLPHLTDEDNAKRLLENTLPFINRDEGFCPSAYSMVLLQTHTHIFRLARAVYNSMEKNQKPWTCRTCLYLFATAAQASGLMGKIPPTYVREGTHLAVESWINRTCGSCERLSERWIKPGILIDLHRDTEYFPITKEENITQKRAAAYTYIPLTPGNDES